MTIERALPLELPPHPFVKQVAETLPLDESLLILDAGAHEGRNSTFLARLGHQVVALTNSYEEAMQGANVTRSLGNGVREKCQFVAGDIRQLSFAPVFHAVLVNEVLHQMTKQQAHSALKALRNITRPGGIHIASGYVVNPREASIKNRARCFWPNELLNNYADAGWTIHKYEEDIPQMSEFNGQQIVHSLAKIVACK
jgi:SAM-dependent methyltransferase